MRPIDVKNALKCLPKTLDETYERILNGIPDTFYREAYTALHLLAVSFRPLGVDELAEAVAIDSENETFVPEDHRLRDVYDVLEICSTLVTCSGFHCVTNR